jgi:putative DNA primase/helicase
MTARDGRDALRDAIDGATLPEPRAVTVRMSDVTPQPVTWLWRGRFAVGKLTVITGDPGLGKSLITNDMAARISTGGHWPDGAPCLSGNALILSAEDDPADTIRPRLDSAGADVSRVHIMVAVRRNDGRQDIVTLTDLEAIAEAVERIGNVRLVVIDPLSAYVPADIDSHRDTAVRALLRPLSELAARLAVAVVAVAHRPKAAGANPVHGVMGSLAFAAAARAVWMVVRDPEDDGRRLMAAAKNNIGPDNGGLAYCVEAPDDVARICWEPGKVDVDLAAILAAGGRQKSHTKIDDAADWLADILYDGPRAAKELGLTAEAAGFSRATVRRAKTELGIISERQEFGGAGGWYWRLPSDPKSTAGGNSPKGAQPLDAHVSAFGAARGNAGVPGEPGSKGAQLSTVSTFGKAETACEGDL